MLNFRLHGLLAALLTLPVFGGQALTSLGAALTQDTIDVPDTLLYTATPHSGLLIGTIQLDEVAVGEPAALAAFSPTGVCVGWNTLVEEGGQTYAALAIYGDDATSPEVDGLLANEAFSLGLYLFDSDTLLSYVSVTGQTALTGWLDNFGAPIPEYSDPSRVFSFYFNIQCDDVEACNYAPGSFGDEDCDLPDEGYGCDGACLEDEDGDGVCDDFEVLGCTEPDACNFMNEATEEDGSCASLDECGVCDGPGEIYACGCADIPQGNCDCDGNQVDAVGVCGGTCEEDIDTDGICDDVDDCVGALDACGICNGPGAIYECGCADIPPSKCDCNGNELDALGDCGGPCAADADMDGICDDVDDCIGGLDACGVCNGPGAIYECGCDDIPEGNCDCDGNEEDAVGVCGGDCDADLDSDGVCDDVDDCVGELDTCGVCNGPGEIYECGCADIPQSDCDCDGNQVDAVGVCGGTCTADADADGLCDDVDDCVGEPDALGICNGGCGADVDGDGVCDDNETLGCDDPDAVNYDDDATENDGSCNYEDLDVPDGFDFVTSPYSATILGTVTLDGLAGSGLDWIGAFNNTGLCVGANHLNLVEGSSFMALTIYGDDPTTPGVVDGLLPGDAFTLRLFDASEAQIISYNGGQQLLGWVNTNGGPLPGYSNAEAVFAFFTPPCPDTDGDGLCNEDDPCPDQIADAVGICGGDCVADVDCNGVCDDAEVLGCNATQACNFNPLATQNDGSCEFMSCLVVGCTDSLACNYDPDANLDNGLCLSLDACGECGGPGAIEACGCTDIPVGDCDCDGNQLDALGECGGTCALDVNENGICDADEVLGCTIAAACNFDASANVDDGSCDFLTCIVPGCTDPDACNFNPVADFDNDSCLFLEDCNASSTPGCTYADADNFDPTADEDDGSCTFSLEHPCGLEYDGDFDGSVGASDLINLLTEFGLSCD